MSERHNNDAIRGLLHLSSMLAHKVRFAAKRPREDAIWLEGRLARSWSGAVRETGYLPAVAQADEVVKGQA